MKETVFLDTELVLGAFALLALLTMVAYMWNM
jgi:hypothetical protein